jgi:hypothetical protein
LQRPVHGAHKLLLRGLARLGGEAHRESVIELFFSAFNADDPELASGAAEFLAEFDPRLGPELEPRLRRAYMHYSERGSKCLEHNVFTKDDSCPECGIVLPSPRLGLLKELNRLCALPFNELIDLATDSLHDVSNWATDMLAARAETDGQTFSDALDRIEAGHLSLSILGRLLKLPITKGSVVANKAERLLKTSNLQLRLATLGQLTGEWIDRGVAMEYLRNSLNDEHPAVRTLATRVLRLIAAT